MTIKPITPSEVVAERINQLPDQVIDCWNKTIIQKFDGHCAIIPQNLIVQLLASRMDCARQTVFDNGWLDIESLYIKNGWKVEYDKPAYNENYEALFVFTIDNNRLLR